jgi:hypothetical protein
MNVTSKVRGSTSAETDLPLTFIEIFTAMSPPSGMVLCG